MILHESLRAIRKCQVDNLSRATEMRSGGSRRGRPGVVAKVLMKSGGFLTLDLRSSMMYVSLAGVFCIKPSSNPGRRSVNSERICTREVYLLTLNAFIDFLYSYCIQSTATMVSTLVGNSRQGANLTFSSLTNSSASQCWC